MKAPIAVTFDTNTYSTIADPKIGRLLEKWWPYNRDRWQSKKRRVCWWYIQRCIRKGRIEASIPEAAFTAESVRNTDRVDLLLSIGTNTQPPSIPPTRQEVIGAALETGFPRDGPGSMRQVFRSPSPDPAPIETLCYALPCSGPTACASCVFDLRSARQRWKQGAQFWRGCESGHWKGEKIFDRTGIGAVRPT